MTRNTFFVLASLISIPASLLNAAEPEFQKFIIDNKFRSEGVNVAPAGTSSGWSATATHDALGGSEGCAIYYGTATAPSSPTAPSAEGEVACTA